MHLDSLQRDEVWLFLPRLQEIYASQLMVLSTQRNPPKKEFTIEKHIVQQDKKDWHLQATWIISLLVALKEQRYFAPFNYPPNKFPRNTSTDVNYKL